MSRARRSSRAPPAGGDPGRVEAAGLNLIQRRRDIADRAALRRRGGAELDGLPGRDRRPGTIAAGRSPACPAGEHGRVEREPDRFTERLLHFAPQVEVGVVYDGFGHRHDRGDFLGFERDARPTPFRSLLQPGVAVHEVGDRQRREHRQSRDLG